MKFDASTFYVDYLMKGFYCFNAEEILSTIKIKPFDILEQIAPDHLVPPGGFEYTGDYEEAEIKRLGVYISEHFLNMFPHQLKLDVFSYHVCSDVQRWHNDAELALVGQNASINCFFDDMDSSKGGMFMMQPYKPNAKTNDPSVVGVYPKKYDIIILNQNRNYIHRVESSIYLRRLISYACSFTDFNPLLDNFTQ